jgi:hypothetical protein
VFIKPGPEEPKGVHFAFALTLQHEIIGKIQICNIWEDQTFETANMTHQLSHFL